jgi:glycosyltransferase
MKISIITICYNNERDIRSTVESVINQSYCNIEYIIVDGLSQDKTLDIVSEYRNGIAKIISEPDKGLYDAINKGIQNATGDVVGLIHAGDRLYNKYIIEKIAHSFTKNNDIDIIYGHSKIVNIKGQTVRVNKSPEYNSKYLKWGWAPSHLSIYTKRILFEKYGYYNLDLHPISDYEWIIRYFYVYKLNIRLLNEFIVKFSLGGVSTSNYSKLFNKETVERFNRAWTINHISAPFGITYLKYLYKVKQYMLAIFYK